MGVEVNSLLILFYRAYEPKIWPILQLAFSEVHFPPTGRTESLTCACFSPSTHGKHPNKHLKTSK